MTREGGCLCGAVRFKAEGEPINVRLCHCRNCQKAMGSPFFARALFRAERDHGSRARPVAIPPPNGSTAYSARSAARGCSHGAPTAPRQASRSPTFDDRHAFAPTEHIWLSAKMDWVRLNDDLPQYPEGPPPS